MNTPWNSKQKLKFGSRLQLSLITGAALGVLVFCLEIVFLLGRGYAWPTELYGVVRFTIGILIYALIGCTAGLFMGLFTDVYCIISRQQLPTGNRLIIIYSSGIVSFYLFLIAGRKINSYIEAGPTAPVSLLTDILILIAAIGLYLILYNLGYFALRKLGGTHAKHDGKSQRLIR